MKYIDEYRDADAARRLAEHIRRITTRPWTLMEVCGGQTHVIVKYGLDEMLPREIGLLHGPGCPVCVTPLEFIDMALAIAARPGTVFCSFGDMLRVPGSAHDLLSVKAAGADVRMLYSPLDAVKLAQANPARDVVFFAVGFETTAPASALAVMHAKRLRLKNFSLLAAHVRVPPALELILASPRNRVQGFLAAGHVCTVMGWDEYISVARRFKVPVVVTGFEPLDLLQGVALCVAQLERGAAEVENQYTRSVRQAGNTSAQALMREVFRVADRKWRGIGVIPQSGLALRDEFSEFDAALRFGVNLASVEEPRECISGEILSGRKKPPACPAFGARCTPARPLGAPMVSSEGACAAYFRYGKKAEAQETPA